jgi:hypothetical protein
MLHNRPRFEQWLPAGFDGEFQWDFLLPAFKETKIKPMDFDAVVERNGHVLIFETKSDGKSIDTGQAITLTDQWSKGSSILCLAGKTRETVTGYAAYWGWKHVAGVKVGDRKIRPCKWDDVLFVTRCWFCRVNGIAEPERESWDRELWLWDFERNERAA